MGKGRVESHSYRVKVGNGQQNPLVSVSLKLYLLAMPFFQEKYVNPFTDRNSLEEACDYDNRLKMNRDFKNSLDTARREGRERAHADIARNAIVLGLDDIMIAKITGLSVAQVSQLRANTK